MATFTSKNAYNKFSVMQGGNGSKASANSARRKAEEIYNKKTSGFPSLVQYANRADEAAYAVFAITASYAATASFLYTTVPVTVGTMDLTGGITKASLGTNLATTVYFQQPIDVIDVNTGNAAMWLVSINNGTSYKTNEVVASWSTTTINYYVTEVSEIGSVPVTLSATIVGGFVNLVATPRSGVWTIKLMHTIV